MSPAQARLNPALGGVILSALIIVIRFAHDRRLFRLVFVPVVLGIIIIIIVIKSAFPRGVLHALHDVQQGVQQRGGARSALGAM